MSWRWGPYTGSSCPRVASERGHTSSVAHVQVIHPRELPKPEWVSWIVANTNGDWNGWATLHLRDETGTSSLEFASVRDALRFQAWNHDDSLCRFCCCEPKAPGDTPYCPDCRDLLEEHRQLRHRYELACSVVQRSQVIVTEIERYRGLLLDMEFTDGDKAAVLDRILAEIEDA